MYALLEAEVKQGDTLREDNQLLKGQIRDVEGQLGIQEAVLEQSKKNNLALGNNSDMLNRQLKEIQTEEALLRTKLEESLQQTSASINSLGEMQNRLEYKHKMFSEIEVKYKEGQRKTSDLIQQSNYWKTVANTLQEENDELDKTRSMLRSWASEVDAENQEKRGAVKVTQAELTKLRGTVAMMTANIDGLIQENKDVSSMNSDLKAELARPKYLSMSAIERSEGFKLPMGGFRKHFLGNSKPTLLKFKKEVV